MPTDIDCFRGYTSKQVMSAFTLMVSQEGIDRPVPEKLTGNRIFNRAFYKPNELFIAGTDFRSVANVSGGLIITVGVRTTKELSSVDKKDVWVEELKAQEKAPVLFGLKPKHCFELLWKHQTCPQRCAMKAEKQADRKWKVSLWIPQKMTEDEMVPEPLAVLRKKMEVVSISETDHVF